MGKTTKKQPNALTFEAAIKGASARLTSGNDFEYSLVLITDDKRILDLGKGTSDRTVKVVVFTDADITEDGELVEANLMREVFPNG